MVNNDDDCLIGNNEEIWQQTLRHVQKNAIKSTKEVQRKYSEEQIDASL